MAPLLNILTMVLGSILEKGKIIEEPRYIHKARTLWHIKNKDKSKKQLACSTLNKEFKRVMLMNSRLPRLKEYTLENTYYNKII